MFSTVESASSNRRIARLATSCLALAIVSSPAFAQDAPSADSASSDAAVDAVVVTGSRLTTGFRTPTPVTTLSVDQLRAASANNIATALNQLPSFNNSVQSQNTITGVTGANGQNILNLRGLGGNRQLVLLDGRRLPSTNTGGSVDVNVIPQNLVRRVDVVTGGASAAYGSDAVAGVTNFVLDTKFEGLRGQVQTGVSQHSDMPSKQVSLAGGKSFMDGRARVIASGEYYYQKGIEVGKATHRDWFDVPAGQFPNPNGTTPTILVVPNIRSSVGSNGGLISSGPLKGIQFLPNGGTAPFNYGTITGTSFQSGGDGGNLNYGFSPTQKRHVEFIHGEFDVTPNMTVFAEGQYSNAKTISRNQIISQTGAADQFTIFQDNAFLPASVKAQMVAGNIASIPVGRFQTDFPSTKLTNTAELARGVIGIKGNIANTPWTYNASYMNGRTKQDILFDNLTITRNIYAAADAVVNPANGQVVCRSTLQGSDSGCQPLNIFGSGSPSAAAIDYVTGLSAQYITLKQQVFQANLSGDLGDKIQLGAGPISVAAGFEYRTESVDQKTDALSPTNVDLTGVRGAPSAYQGKQGPFRFFNPLPFSGDYNVKEGYIEVGVPILKDLAFAKALNVDGALRHTDYSISGGVNTWKVGVNYEIGDFRFQYTKSRDIRAPTLLEFYNAGTQFASNLIYQGRTTPAFLFTTGNPNLKPERALTTTVGLSYRSSWIPGFFASVNYYDIKITDAIGTAGPQNTIDDCAAGNQLQCKQFTVTPINTLFVYTPNLNLSAVARAGFDMEADYTTDVRGGSLQLRVLATRQTRDYTQVPGSAQRIGLGATTSPKWRGSLQVRYTAPNWSFFIQERYIGPTLMDPTRVQGVYTNDNSVPKLVYTDISATYNIDGAKGRWQIYGSVDNLLNQKPPVATSNPTVFSYPSSVAYDRIGRYFNAGLRFRF